MARGISPATSMARRRLWVWQAGKANANNPKASGRVSDGGTEIHCQAQAEDIKSLASYLATRASIDVESVEPVATDAGRPAGDSTRNTERTAEGQQALTAQPAMPPAQQTAQTADADQASTSHLPRLPRNPRSPHAPHAAARTASNPRAKGAGLCNRQDGVPTCDPTRP